MPIYKQHQTALRGEQVCKNVQDVQTRTHVQSQKMPAKQWDAQAIIMLKQPTELHH
jgi:hypothetical protein